MNKIEKKDILPIGDELANLKDAVLKQVPNMGKPQEAEVVRSSKDVLANLKNAILHPKESQIQRPKELGAKENLTANESSEKHNEKTPTSRNKVIGIRGKNITREDIHLPLDASVASNINRIRDYNKLARITQEIAEVPLMGRAHTNEIPENLA
jgi:hypothetical protein